jgi:hypothetical protein
MDRVSLASHLQKGGSILTSMLTKKWAGGRCGWLVGKWLQLWRSTGDKERGEVGDWTPRRVYSSNQYRSRSRSSLPYVAQARRAKSSSCRLVKVSWRSWRALILNCRDKKGNRKWKEREGGGEEGKESSGRRPPPGNEICVGDSSWVSAPKR